MVLKIAWKDWVGQDFSDGPCLLGDPCGHGWRAVGVAWWPLADRYTQRSRFPAVVVDGNSQPSERHVEIQILGERIGFPRLAGVAVSLGTVEAFDITGVDRARNATVRQRRFQLLVGPLDRLLADFHHAAIFSPLASGCEAQFLRRARPRFFAAASIIRRDNDRLVGLELIGCDQPRRQSGSCVTTVEASISSSSVSALRFLAKRAQPSFGPAMGKKTYWG